MSVSSVNGRYQPLHDNDLVSHLTLKDVHSVQYLDKSSSKWITYFRNIPGIQVTRDCVLHLKEKGTIVGSNALSNPSTPLVVKQELLSPLKREPSPLKRRLDVGVIDLTSSPDEPLDKRSRTSSRYSSPSPSGRGSITRANIGGIPARLGKFPPLTIKDLDTRLQWMEDNVDSGTTKERFRSVFACEFTKSTYYNHKNLWKALKESGSLNAFDGDDEWMPVYSANVGKNATDSSDQDQDLLIDGNDETEDQVVRTRSLSVEL